MVWIAFVLTFLGVVFTAVLAARGSRYVWTAAAGTLLSLFAVLSSASIGIFVMPVAALLIVIAAPRLRDRDRTT